MSNVSYHFLYYFSHLESKRITHFKIKDYRFKAKEITEPPPFPLQTESLVATWSAHRNYCPTCTESDSWFKYWGDIFDETIYPRIHPSRRCMMQTLMNAWCSLKYPHNGIFQYWCFAHFCFTRCSGPYVGFWTLDHNLCASPFTLASHVGTK